MEEIQQRRVPVANEVAGRNERREDVEKEEEKETELASGDSDAYLKSSFRIFR